MTQWKQCWLTARLQRRYLVAILIAVGVTSAQPLAAFKGREHEPLSTLALAVALESVKGEMSPNFEQEVRASFLACSTDVKTRRSGCDQEVSTCVPFGLLTRAVDRVLRPEGLIPAERLHQNNSHQTPDQEQAPGRCGSQNTTTETVKRKLEEVSEEKTLFGFASCRAEGKADLFWNWLFAVHHNASHFERCAAMKYNQLHRLAIDLARPGNSADPAFVALFAEAVALHFLQDSFAPGHLLTPRAGSTDILARGLHNSHNKAGAPVLIQDVGPWSQLEDALDLVLTSQQPEIVAQAIRDLSLDPEKVAAAQRVSCRRRFLDDSSVPLDDFCYFGDGDMHDRQAVDLLLLSAASIREVLLANDPLRSLRIDFHEWSALPTDNDDDVVQLGTLHRPWLQVVPTGSESGLDQQVSTKALAAFLPCSAKDQDRSTMSLRHPELSVARVFGDSAQEAGWRVEAGLPSGSPSDRDIRHRDKECNEDNEADCYFDRQGRRGAFGTPGTLLLQYETWDGYEGLGFVLRTWPYAKRTKRHGWDIMGGIDLGWKWYFSDRRDTDRFIWGGHFAVGFGIVFVDLGFERGSRLQPDGGHDRNSNYSVGLRVQIP